MSIRYRVAHAGDAEHVAALHTASWRRHHRGAYADSYLDEDADRGSSSTTCTSPGPQQRSGIGTALLDRAAQGILERVTGPRAYLWVLEQNAAAQLFCRVPRP